jgi:hypothetical protein
MKVMAGKGCPHCAGNARLSKEIVNQKLSQRGISMIGEYYNARTPSLFRCVRGHEWKTNPDNILNKSGCPRCSTYGFNPGKPAYIYLLDYVDFIKYGITNDLETRLSTHRFKNGEFVVLSTKLYENGNDAVNWEKQIKKIFGGRFVTKEKCPDGYTETLSPTLVEDIKKYFS